MSASIQSLQLLEEQSRKVQSLLENLEAEHLYLEQMTQDLIAETGILARFAKEGKSSYAFERASRLNNLIKNFHETHGFQKKTYATLHRQIERIQNTDLSHYMSHAMNRKLKSIVEARAKQEHIFSDQTIAPEERLHPSSGNILYRIDGMLFMVQGQVLEAYQNILPDQLKANVNAMSSSSRIDIFPFPAPASFRIYSEANGFDETGRHRASANRASHAFVIQDPGSNRILVLWYEEVVHLADLDGPPQKLMPSEQRHRLIEGSFQHSGQTIHVLRFPED